MRAQSVTTLAVTKVVDCEPASHTDRTGRTLYESIWSIDLSDRAGMRSLVPGRPDISDEVNNTRNMNNNYT